VDLVKNEMAKTMDLPGQSLVHCLFLYKLSNKGADLSIAGPSADIAKATGVEPTKSTFPERLLELAGQ
jgi:hypothetical protein